MTDREKSIPSPERTQAVLAVSSLPARILAHFRSLNLGGCLRMDGDGVQKCDRIDPLQLF